MYKSFVCRSVRRSLPDYVTQRLSTVERDRIDRHLLACHECAAINYSMRNAAELAEQAREAPLPASLSGWSELRAGLREDKGAVPGLRRRQSGLVFAGAALGLVALAAWLVVTSHPATPAITSRNSSNTVPLPDHQRAGRAEQSAARVPLIARSAVNFKTENQGTPTFRERMPGSNGPKIAQRKAILDQVGNHWSDTRTVAAHDSVEPTTNLPTPRRKPGIAALTAANSRGGRGAIAVDTQVIKRAGAVIIQTLKSPSPDDLAYLNPDASASLAPWTQRPLNEIHRLEIALRRQVEGGDSFVTIPLPQIAGQGEGAVKVAVAAHQKEAAIIDARLVREIGLRMKGVSFADLCGRLTTETNIRFTANRRIADDKVTILCHPRSLRAIMRLIARHFGFSWVRSGEEGAYEYELTQTLRSQLLEEGLREKDQEEMLLAIDRSMDRFRKYRGMPLSQVSGLMSKAKGLAEIDPIFQLQRGGLVPMNLYFGLSQSEMDTLRTGRIFTVDLMGRGAVPLPPGMTDGIWHSFDESYDRERKFAREQGSSAAHIPEQPTRLTASLHLDRSKPGEFVLKGGLSDQQTGLGASLAVAKSPAFMVENAKTNAKLASDPDLRRSISMKPPATCRLERTPYPDTESLYEQPGDKLTTADVLEGLFDATGIDLIGDYFSHLQDPNMAAVKDMNCFAALNQIADSMRMRWTKLGSKREAWLQFRSGTFYYDRPQEIPNRLLERWKALRKRQGVLSLEDLTEIGQLPDPQLDSIWMARAAIAMYGLDEWQMGRIAQLRPHWRFLGKLPDTERGSVWTEKGLAYVGLSADLQNQLLALAYDGDPERPDRRQVREGSLRVLYAFATHPVQYGGSYAVLQSNPLLFVYKTTTGDDPNRMAIIGPWNGIYGMRPEMIKPDGFSIVPGPNRP